MLGARSTAAIACVMAMSTMQLPDIYSPTHKGRAIFGSLEDVPHTPHDSATVPQVRTVVHHLKQPRKHFLHPGDNTTFVFNI
jgi:hypothetical protein